MIQVAPSPSLRCNDTSPEGGRQDSAPPLGELAPQATERAREAQTMAVEKNHHMLPRARELRKNMTEQERKLWYLFLRDYPVKIYRQRIIESFIVDFYCYAAKLVIELDGPQHTTGQGLAYDRERTAVLEKYGMKVLRFSNAAVDRDFSKVCEAIHGTIQERLRQK